MTSVTPEGRVKAKLKACLQAAQAYYFMPVQTGLGTTTLDFLVCNGGHFLGLECKARGKELTLRQELVARQIRAAGGEAYKVTLDDSGELEFTPCGLIKSEGS